MMQANRQNFLKPEPFSPDGLAALLRGDEEKIHALNQCGDARQWGLQIAIIILGSGCYGAAMGWWRDPQQALFTAVKFPLIILLTALGNALINGMLAPLLGLNLPFRRSLSAVLMSFAVTSAIFGAFSPLVAFLLWYRHCYREFQYYAFLIGVGYLVSYVGYIIVPARGPRYLLNSLQHMPLQGLWLFRSMQDGLDKLESYHYDCFPSGHTELTLLACWSSRMVSKGWFRIYLAYTPFLIFATVYLRYHYTVDLAAGATAAFVLAAAGPALYKKLS